MNFRLSFKIAAILLLLVVLMVPMMRIHALVKERQALRDAVVQDIARSAGYAQHVTGPLLVVPWTRTVREGGVARTVSGRVHLLPADFALDGVLSTQERQRGIYRARIYGAALTLEARFEVAPNYGVTDDIGSYDFGEPVLALGISDIRGIGNALTLERDGRRIAFEPGSATPVLAAGVHAPLGSGGTGVAQVFSVRVALDLQGTGSFTVTPVGRESRVTLASDWPHPAFAGEFLPTDREVSTQGFKADWQTSFFATNMEDLLAACAASAGTTEPACAPFASRQFGVDFVDPVDHYLRSERATKYAFLFIGLTFASFFLFEVVRGGSVHPLQYGLVGLSLAVFFLLLIALSEHIGFNGAYAAAAGACVLLNGVYGRHVLGGPREGLIFGAALAALYGLLYGILASEDYALLMGAVLVFGVLSAAMLLTRGVNWTGVGQVP